MLKPDRPKKVVAQYVSKHSTPITGCATLGEVLNATTKLIEQYGEDARCEFESDSLGIMETLSYHREETDQEYRNRCDREDAAERQRVRDQAAHEASERALLKRLKAKYGEA